MLKRLEKLVAAGRLDASVLEEVKKATSPDVHHASGGCCCLLLSAGGSGQWVATPCTSVKRKGAGLPRRASA